MSNLLGNDSGPIPIINVDISKVLKLKDGGQSSPDN